MRLVVGLGNPGARYARTRHNIGAMAVGRALERWAIPRESAGEVQWGRGFVGAVEVVLALRVGWMNLSGPAVKALLERHEVSPQDLVVVHDDLDLPLGRLRIKRQGGTGGHNGILSIVSALETHQFCRLKIGIGALPAGEEAQDYVLRVFSQDEWSCVENVLDRAVAALECLMVDGVDAAMNRFNVREPVG